MAVLPVLIASLGKGLLGWPVFSRQKSPILPLNASIVSSVPSLVSPTSAPKKAPGAIVAPSAAMTAVSVGGLLFHTKHRFFN